MNELLHKLSNELSEQKMLWRKAAKKESLIYVRYRDNPIIPEDIVMVEIKEFSNGEEKYTKLKDFKEQHWNLLELLMQQRARHGDASASPKAEGAN